MREKSLWLVRLGATTDTWTGIKWCTGPRCSGSNDFQHRSDRARPLPPCNTTRPPRLGLGSSFLNPLAIFRPAIGLNAYSSRPGKFMWEGNDWGLVSPSASQPVSRAQEGRRMLTQVGTIAQQSVFFLCRSNQFSRSCSFASWSIRIPAQFRDANFWRESRSFLWLLC